VLVRHAEAVRRVVQHVHPALAHEERVDDVIPRHQRRMLPAQQPQFGRLKSLIVSTSLQVWVRVVHALPCAIVFRGCMLSMSKYSARRMPLSNFKQAVCW